MPRPHVGGGDGGQRLRQAADRQAVPASPKAAAKASWNGKAEHVVRDLLRLGDHESALGFDVGVGEMGSGEDGVEQRPPPRPRCSLSTEAPKPSQSDAELVASDAAETLEGEGQRGGVEVSRAADRGCA